jgi:UBX domain-containing protein 1
VNEEAAKTTIQIRFHNGEKASLTVNMSHTVADIHEFVMCAAPIDGEYLLITGFPPKPLDDPSKTIE